MSSHQYGNGKILRPLLKDKKMMTHRVSGLWFFLLAGLACCKSAERTAIVRNDSAGKDYTIRLHGTVKDVISGQPIPNAKVSMGAFTGHLYDTTDNSGNFDFKTIDNDSIIRNNPGMFSQTDYRVGWLLSADGYHTYYDSINFPSSDHTVARTKTTYLVPYNIDSLILGWTVKDLVDSLRHVPCKQRLYLKNNGSAVLQFEIQNDVFLQVYTEYDTLKWKDGEVESFSNAAFRAELYERKITGTGRLIWGRPNSTRYLNVTYPNIRPIDVGGRVE